MKKNVFIISSLLFVINIFGQKKDTLFFKSDRNYILYNQDYKEWFAPNSYKGFEREILKKFNLTGTQGYFMFKKKDTLYNLTPKKTQSLKDYVENKSFYYLGKYNKIVNITVLKDKLFNKYKIFIVDENKFIEIRQHPYENYYHPFHPIKYHDKEKYPKLLRDTLFFNYNDKFLLKRWQNPINKEFSYGIKGNGNNGGVYLLERKIYSNLKPRKIKCLKKILKESGAYNSFNKLNDWKLSKYLSNYKIFIVKKSKFIKVEAIHEVE